MKKSVSLLLTISIIAISFAAIFVKWSEAPATIISMYRMNLACLLLLPIVWVKRKEFLKLEPSAKRYFRRWIGSEEFINNIERWCLWLGECSPNELREMPHALERVEAVKKFRLASKSLPTKELAKTPTRFHTEFFSKKTFLVLPQVSSQKRYYVPIAFISFLSRSE